MSAARRKARRLRRRQERRASGKQQAEHLSNVRPANPRQIEWIDKEGIELYESFDFWKRRFPASSNKSAHDKYKAMINSLRTDSEQEIARWRQYERLSGDREGLSSVRYNRRDRIVFRIAKVAHSSGGEAETLEIHEAGGHYGD